MSARSRVLVALFAALLLASACGSSTTVGAASTSTETSQDSVPQDSVPQDSAPTEQESTSGAPAGASSGTLMLSTGETWDLAIRSCDTQATDPNALLNENFFDVFADIEGGLDFSLNSASFAESTEPETFIGGLAGERDENGVNPRIDYVVFGELFDNPDAMITVDGARVSGQVLLDAKFSQNIAFGETVAATFEFNCV